MNTNVKSICEIVEDIKENITDYQYKTIMDDLMVINNKKEEVKEVQEDDTDDDEDDFRVLNEEDTVNRRLFNNLFNLNKTQFLKLNDKKEFNKRLDIMINDIMNTVRNYEHIIIH